MRGIDDLGRQVHLELAVQLMSMCKKHNFFLGPFQLEQKENVCNVAKFEDESDIE